MQNSYLSESFKLERGCRQGDPISPYIFIICAEILSILVENNSEVKGITIDGEEYLISQYADDTTFTLNGSSESLYSTMTLLAYYSEISGLKINYTNYKATAKDVYRHIRWKLDWGANQFILLGINFSLNLEDILIYNCDSKIKQIQNVIKLWSLRKLTVLGRVTIIKTLIISKLTHLFISLLNPPKPMIKHLNKMLFQFIWQNKPEKIKRELLLQDYKNGGIKRSDIQNVITSLKS